MPASSKMTSPSTTSSKDSDNRAEFALFSSIPPTYRAFRSLRVASAARFSIFPAIICGYHVQNPISRTNVAQKLVYLQKK